MSSHYFADVNAGTGLRDMRESLKKGLAAIKHQTSTNL